MHNTEYTAKCWVAVGTALTGRRPHRSQRAELPHWAPASDLGVKTLLRPWVQYAGLWSPGISQLVHSGPRHAVFVAAPPVVKRSNLDVVPRCKLPTPL